MDRNLHSALVFGHFTLDLTRGCLQRDGLDIVLRPKTFELLRYLAENAGRLVPKDELCQAVWPRIFVSDDSLVQCVRELRDKLGDHDHCLIKTAPRRGYLFDVVVESGLREIGPINDTKKSGTACSAAAANQNTVSDSPSRRTAAWHEWWFWALGATVLLVALAFLIAAIWAMRSREISQGAAFGPTKSAPLLSLVVLPFQNLNADPEQDYFADGVTENLTTGLSRISGSVVIARSTASTYKNRTIDVRQVGRELGIRYVLEGTVRRSGDQIRVTAWLVNAATATNIWSESFDADRGNLARLVDEVTARLARIFSVQLVRAESERSVRERPNNPDAVDLSMRARMLLERAPKGSDLSEPRRLFREALQLDAGLAEAWIGLSRSYSQNVRFSPTREDDLRQASEAAERAIALEPYHAAAHWVRGWVHYEQKRMEQALYEFEYALQLDPNDVAAQGAIAAANIMLGRPENALTPLANAMRLSPNDRDLPTWQTFLGVAYLHMRRDGEATEWLRKSAALNPNDHFTRLFLAAALGLLDREAEASTEIAELLRLQPGFTLSRFQALEPSDAPAFLEQRRRIYQGLHKAGLPE
jgi:TolB-like protein/DNA-binding winged helix-turn-helix (wHTH) protein/thioredoxin-like negative regulator of GroEL